jgi:hypothetical protein
MDPISPSPGSSHRRASRKPSHRALPVACLAIFAGVAGDPRTAASQVAGETEMPERLAVFLDCGFCDEEFIRQEMAYVDYVRDREVADVHVLVTQQNTGAGGEAQTFDLIGLGPFEGMDYSTVYTTNVSATEAEERDGLLRTLQAVLVPYLMQTPMGARVRVDVDAPDELGTEQAQPRTIRGTTGPSRSTRTAARISSPSSRPSTLDTASMSTE